MRSSRSITIGGRLENTKTKRDTDDAMMRHLKKPLLGVLSGLTLNRNWLFHLVLKNDSRVVVSGDVKRYSFPLEIDFKRQTSSNNNQTQHEQHVVGMRDKMLASSSVPQSTADELLLSGETLAGSGCRDNVDDEDCVSFIPNTSGTLTLFQIDIMLCLVGLIIFSL
ncbi:unnamed protein product [Soboliphyme baturini]|uniref:Transmembrane protein n=1 Tax=Soboliphyme baturini TaxID=241478 RepID=A0A183IZY3_9BILA|nr:unnamed protein product [Soboliphyme baturini]